MVRLINIFFFLLNNTKTSRIFKFFSSSSYLYILFVVYFRVFLFFLFTSMTTLLLSHIVGAYLDLPRYYQFLCTGFLFIALTVHLESSCFCLMSVLKWRWLQILSYSSCGEVKLIFLPWTWAGLWQLCSVECGRSDTMPVLGIFKNWSLLSAMVSESSKLTCRKYAYPARETTWRGQEDYMERGVVWLSSVFQSHLYPKSTRTMREVFWTPQTCSATR